MLNFLLSSELEERKGSEVMSVFGCSPRAIIFGGTISINRDNFKQKRTLPPLVETATNRQCVRRDLIRGPVAIYFLLMANKIGPA